MKADDPAFGIEPERYHGYVSATKSLDSVKPEDSSSSSGNKFNGTIPSKVGSYMDYYRDVVAAIKGEKEVAVKPEESRNGIRVIELAMESAKKGVTVPWSDK